jgi:hypothetical protein
VPLRKFPGRSCVLKGERIREHKHIIRTSYQQRIHSCTCSSAAEPICIHTYTNGAKRCSHFSTILLYLSISHCKAARRAARHKGESQYPTSDTQTQPRTPLHNANDANTAVAHQRPSRFQSATSPFLGYYTRPLRFPPRLVAMGRYISPQMKVGPRVCRRPRDSANAKRM